MNGIKILDECRVVPASVFIGKISERKRLRPRYQGKKECESCVYRNELFCLSPVGQCLQINRNPVDYGTFKGSEAK